MRMARLVLAGALLWGKDEGTRYAQLLEDVRQTPVEFRRQRRT